MIQPALYDTWKKDLFNVLLKRPIARPQYISRQARIDDATLRKAWTVHIWEEQESSRTPALPPCQWCGMPTGNYCDNDCSSEWVKGWLAALCTECEYIFGGCRGCSPGAIMRQHRDEEQQQYDNSMSEEEETTRDHAASSQDITSSWPSFTVWEEVPVVAVCPGGQKIYIYGDGENISTKR